MKRSQVVTVVDELTETSPLRIALLIDASASMKPKLGAVEDAIRDLALSLEAREGSSEISVFHFPGRSSSEEAMLDMDWTSNVSEVRSLFSKLKMREPRLQDRLFSRCSNITVVIHWMNTVTAFRAGITMKEKG